jgi:hypothetical protein
LTGLALGLFACACSATSADVESLALDSQAVSNAVFQVDCGGGAVGTFSADQWASGGSTYSTTQAITIAGVANAGPAGIYQTERYGNHSYLFSNLGPNQSYTVRLHFAEIYFTSAGSRQFNVVINGTQVLTNLDIFATVGANTALVKDFTTTASSSGTINVQYVNVVENAKSSGIEILSNAPSSNQAPTVASPAAAASTPVTGTSTALSVLGADDGGESNLTYSWAASGTPPAPVTFSSNGTNASKHTTVTFAKAGMYNLVATLRDSAGASTTSNVHVSVNQTATDIVVAPGSATVPANGSQQFSKNVRDQFALSMSSQPTVTWSVNGGGVIDASGLFTAGATNGGPFTVTATSGNAVGSSSVTVQSATTYSTNFDLTESPISEGGAWHHANVDSAYVYTANGLAFGTQTGSGSYNDSYAILSGFPPNQSASGVIHLDNSITGGTHEVELLLRFGDGTHFGQGYECNLSYDGNYTQIVRIDPGSFTYLSPTNGNPTGNPGHVKDGDVFSAQMVGNVIKVFLNGVLINTATDNTYTSGNPGMAFWRGNPSAHQDDYGYTSFSATSL